MWGLFGLLYSAFVGGAKITKNIQNEIENKNSRNEAISKGRNTYLDSDLCMRDIATNKKIMNYSIPNQYGGRDDVLKVVGSDEILVNKTDIARKEEEKKWRDFALMVGGSTYKISHHLDYYQNVEIASARYKDIKTGDIYVIADVKHGCDKYSFYMDVNTKKFIRPTDSWILRTLCRKKEMEENKWHTKLVHPDNVIEEWNNKDEHIRKLYVRHRNHGIEYLQETIIEELKTLGKSKIFNDNENYENIKHIFYWDDIIEEENKQRKEQQQKKIAELKLKKYIIVNVTKHTIVAKLPGGKLEYF